MRFYRQAKFQACGICQGVLIEMTRRQRWLRHISRIILFPWFFAYLAGVLPRWLLRRGVLRRPWARFFHFCIYLTICLPLTLLCLVEVVISLNEQLLGEQPSYRLQSDYTAGLAHMSFPQMGPPTVDIEPVDKGTSDRETYHRYLMELYAPVIFQKVSHHPEWDIPVFLDFDGTMNPRDNIANEPKYRPFIAGLHGEVTAETEDAYYLTYSLYHIKDYDHPVREVLSSWTFHDNDNEGLHIRVDKNTMRITEVETWFHNRFLLYNLTGKSTGTEPVHGTIHVEKDTHLLVYGQPQGHGVRLVQYTDRETMKKNVKIIRFVGSGKDVPIKPDHSFQDNATYRLKNFDSWYEQAQGPFDQDGDPHGDSLFAHTIPVGRDETGKPLFIGRFISGLDYRIGSWSRPKPMWSWDDGWDQIPIAVWHFLPSFSFSSHAGIQVSHKYLYNRPIEKIFHRKVEEMGPLFRFESARRKDQKWAGLQGRGDEFDRNLYWIAINRALKVYVNYVFRAWGW